MKRCYSLVVAIFFSGVLQVCAATRYVDPNNPNPTFPFTSWATAATNIQDAIWASSAFDTVFVTNGVYASGGLNVSGADISNRVALSVIAITVKSVNGPGVTVIQGGMGTRGAYLTDNAVLSGFTITGANISNTPAGPSGQNNNGAGVWCRSSASVVTNCVIADNYSGLGANQCAGAYRGTLLNCVLTNCGYGGAAYSNVLVNCTLINNVIPDAIYLFSIPPNSVAASFSSLTNCVLIGNHGSNKGGAAYFCSLTGCLISSNSAVQDGGGAYQSVLNNCTLVSNKATEGGATYQGTLNNCILSSNTATNYGGAASSGVLNNCVLVRNISYYGVAYNSTLNNCTVVSNQNWGANSCLLSNCVVYYNGPFGNSSGGTLDHCCTAPLAAGAGNFTNAPLFAGAGDFHLQNNSPCINAGFNGGVTNLTDLDGKPRIVGGTVDVGAYEFQSALHYVNLNNAAPVPPYTSWVSAATNIQDAVDASTNGDVVLVTNGFYATGGRQWYDSGTNRVTLTNRLTLLSVNGPSVTAIGGVQAPGTNAVRCVYMGSNAVLSGFTLTNGQGGIGNYPDGGGVSGAGIGSAVVSNCALVGNVAQGGGGAFNVTLINCSLIGNTATYAGGGAYRGSLINCQVISNTAAAFGGGSYMSSLTNSTLVGNSAPQGSGLNSGSAYNCVIFYNGSTNHLGSTLNFCCTTPLPFPGFGFGNITNEPAFVDLAGLNLRLQSNSSCINSGNNADVATSFDLDGNSRVAGGTVDIGAYEFQSPKSVISYAWLQQYGLPTDGSADFADSDGDSHNNWQEWHARTDPTSDASVLKMLTVSNDVASTTVSWQSVSGVKYFLQRSADLGAAPAFLTVISNLVGQAGITGYTDTNALGDGPFFYRVGVQ
jgi:hypothetical protein